MIITPFSAASAEGRKILDSLRQRFQMSDTSCREAVSAIIADIQQRGDEALLEYTRKFDSPAFTLSQLRVTDEELNEAMNEVSDDFKETLDFAIGRITSFHEHEREESWIKTRENGIITGRLVNPVDSAGLYVPGGQGGKTPLVSSVLMNGIPALIAGVGRRVMCTPPDEMGRVNPALLVAARKIGITEIYKAGSAWAIAALAFGTETIRPVDVIVGPGNQYVAEAKYQVSGRVRIDMIAGPSEVLIIADGGANPSYIAADLLAQAEHDPQALAMLVTIDEDLCEPVNDELERQLGLLSRADIAKKSLTERGVMLVASSMAEAIEIANEIAVEHLEMMIDDPFEWLPKIRHAGAIFLGHNAPESTGDYVAGPNHVLPTMGTARISSALGVETFIKKSSIISYSAAALRQDSGHIMKLAELEGLTAHANSVAIRVHGK